MPAAEDGCSSAATGADAHALASNKPNFHADAHAHAPANGKPDFHANSSANVGANSTGSNALADGGANNGANTHADGDSNATADGCANTGADTYTNAHADGSADTGANCNAHASTSAAPYTVANGLYHAGARRRLRDASRLHLQKLLGSARQRSSADVQQLLLRAARLLADGPLRRERLGLPRQLLGLLRRGGYASHHACAIRSHASAHTGPGACSGQAGPRHRLAKLSAPERHARGGCHLLRRGLRPESEAVGV